MKFTITGELTDLNTYINAERTNRFMAAKIKKEETMRVYAEIMSQKVKPMNKITEMICTWYTKNERKDFDNTVFALKYIMDGLVLAKVIPNDSRAYTGAIYHIPEVDQKKPRVEIEVIE